jgi:DNA helicase HerA-like ATPase
MSDQAEVKAVVGLRGYGKSTQVLRLTKSSPRVLYYDSLGDDYRDGVICHDLGTLERFWRGVYRKRFRLVYRPVDPLADFARICELVYACGDLTFVVDEVQLYFRGAFTEPAFTKVITAGRHANVELIGVTQTPKRLGELLRSQAHEWFVFGVREPQQVLYLRERLSGINADLLTMLPKFSYLHYIDGADCYWECCDSLCGETVRASRAYVTGPTEQPADSGEHPAAR